VTNTHGNRTQTDHTNRTLPVYLVTTHQSDININKVITILFSCFPPHQGKRHQDQYLPQLEAATQIKGLDT